MRYKKRYVRVDATFEPEGRILPRVIDWGEGIRFTVDRVLDIRPAASLKVGGVGLRYRVRILWDTADGAGHRGESYLYLEENRWFVEEKIPQF